jgi:4-amino-4-deoxy-L-arabinose transferase-like glycosyltransferase
VKNTSPSYLESRIASLERHHVAILLGAIVLFCSYGLVHFHDVVTGWDAADLGSITRNYARTGLHFAYPQIDWRGGGSGFVEMQFPLVPYLTGVLYLVFGPHPELGLIIPLLSGIASIFTLYVLGKELFGSAVGLLAGIFLSCSPYWSWEITTYLNDPSMIFCGTFGLLELIRWMRSGRMIHYYLSAASIALAVLLKIPALYLGLPIFFLWWQKHGAGAFRSGYFYIFGILTIVPSAVWYIHAHMLYLESGNTFGILSGGLTKFSTPDMLVSGEFYSRIGGRIFRYGLTPVITLFCIAGMIKWRSSGMEDVGRVWVVSTVIFLLVAGLGAYYGVQYLLPLFPAGALVAAEGFFLIVRRIESAAFASRVSPRGLSLTIVFALLLLLGGNAAFSMRILPHLNGNEEPLKVAAQIVARETKEGRLIILVTRHHLEDQVDNPRGLDTPSQIFYYADRKGWYRSGRWLTPEFVEQCRNEGAAYLVVPVDASTFVASHPAYPLLVARYHARMFAPDCLIMDLQ